MAYQKVGTPRFYIDFFETMKSYGWNHSKMQTKYNEQFEAGTLLTTGNLANFFQDDLFGLSNIETQKSIPPNTEFIINAHASLKDFLCVDTNNQVKIYGALLNFSVPPGGQIYLDYPVFLGHNLQVTTNIEGGLNTDDLDIAWWHTKPGCIIAPQKSDWNIVHDFYDIIDMTITGSYDSSYNVKDFEIGSFSVGQYYDMPLSPDLDLSMSIEYDGFTNIKTLSGHTITQANYQGSPWWYDIDGNKVEPWSVGQSTGISKRNGRRIWSLKFSYMSDKDLFASNYGSSTYGEVGNFLNYEVEDIGTTTEFFSLGSNIVTNGVFAGTDLSGWTLASTATNNEVSGQANISTGGNSNNTIQQAMSNLSIGAQYKVTFERTSGGSGSSACFINTSPETITDYISASETGKYTFNFIADKENQTIGFRAGSHSQTLSIDNVKVQVYNPSTFEYTIDNDDSFSSQVLNKISHGEKFIFQPDNTANNPSDFAICVLDGNSFEMKRTAWNVYDIEMTIREVW